mmetsp:Transcript_35494/g.75815  ORF Transcript_35494/g.75815 Transcript_35494/m.75815 type:complete len:412 (+) Transcript_35494:140-1375(+)
MSDDCRPLYSRLRSLCSQIFRAPVSAIVDPATRVSTCHLSLFSSGDIWYVRGRPSNGRQSRCCVWRRARGAPLVRPLLDALCLDSPRRGRGRRVGRVSEEEVEVVRPLLDEQRDLRAVRRNVLDHRPVDATPGRVDAATRPGVEEPVAPHDVAHPRHVAALVVARQPARPRVTLQRAAREAQARLRGPAASAISVRAHHVGHGRMGGVGAWRPPEVVSDALDGVVVQAEVLVARDGGPREGLAQRALVRTSAWRTCCHGARGAPFTRWAACARWRLSSRRYGSGHHGRRCPTSHLAGTVHLASHVANTGVPKQRACGGHIEPSHLVGTAKTSLGARDVVPRADGVPQRSDEVEHTRRTHSRGIQRPCPRGSGGAPVDSDAQCALTATDAHIVGHLLGIALNEHPQVGVEAV